jgi:hypothetical protein
MAADDHRGRTTVAVFFQAARMAADRSTQMNLTKQHF